MRYIIILMTLFLCNAFGVEYPEDYQDSLAMLKYAKIKFDEPRWESWEGSIIGVWKYEDAASKIKIKFSDGGKFSWDATEIDNTVTWKKEGDFIVVRGVDSGNPRSYFGLVNHKVMMVNADYPGRILIKLE